MPGAARLPVTFFVSPKKVTQEKRARDAAPSGSPLKRCGKRETKQTRLRLRQVSFLIRFPHLLSGSLKAQLLQRHHTIFELRHLAFNLKNPSERTSELAKMRRLRFALCAKLNVTNPDSIASEGSAWMSPQKRVAKRTRNETCLSRRRVCLVSRFTAHFCGYPSKRGGIPRSPFFAYFLGGRRGAKQRK